MIATSHAHKKHLTHPKYRADIDGLRAIAILSVVVFHAFPNWLPGGFVGVDIFFVISGFLISSIIFGNLEHGSFSYYDFYVRRIKRIFPALILVLVTTYVVGWNLLLPDEYKQLGKHIAGGAGFVSNLVLWNEAGYFDKASSVKPLLHLWSLGIEEQFYIFWPLLLGVVWKYRLNFLVTTLCIAVVSFLVNIYSVGDHPVAAFYSPLSRFWELMIGGVLAYLMLHRPQHLPKNTDWQALVGLLLIVIAVVVVDESKVFPGWWALLPALGAFLLISARPTAWVNSNVLGNRAMVWIGLISYPLYLWHWVILSFLRINESGEPAFELRAMAVIASFVLAWLTYWGIERPIRYKTRGQWKIVILCVMLAVIGLIGFNTFQRDGLSFRMMKISPELMGSKPDVASDWRLNECFLEGTDKFADSCVETARPMLFLWGDSHAAALYPGLKQMQAEYHFGVVQRTASACRPLVGVSFADRKLCRKINDENLALVEKLRPEFVLLHANWSDSHDLNELATTVSQLKKAGVENIVLIGPDPMWTDELTRILFSYHRREHKRPPLRMKENNAESAHVLDLAMRAFADAQNIRYVSSLDILCNEEGCMTRTAEDATDIMTMDGTHLTPQGAAYQARIIVRELFEQVVR